MLPFAKLMGVRFKTAELDRVVAELLVRDELCTCPAVAHGGAVMAFADTLGAAGTILNLRAGVSTAAACRFRFPTRERVDALDVAQSMAIPGFR